MKKVLATFGGSAAIAFLTVFLVPFAIAQTSSSTNHMTISISAKGSVKLEGTLSSISGNILNISSWGGTWVADVSSAKLVRRFGGTSTLSEFQNGDDVTVWGTAQTSGWAITAQMVKDNSLQEKGAAFYGTISNLSSAKQTFTLTTANRGTLSVTVPSDAKIYINRRAVTFGDLTEDMRANVSGVWDRNQSTLTAQKISAVKPAPKPMRTRNKSHASSTSSSTTQNQ